MKKDEKWFRDNFKIGDEIKLQQWGDDYILKLVDIGSIYIIVEGGSSSNRWLGHREINCDWIHA